MSDVTMVELAVTRRILVAQEAWNVTVGRAYADRCAAGVFGCWADGHDWLMSVPKLPPAALEQVRWAESERRRFGPAVDDRGSLSVPKRGRERRVQPVPVIARDRQLEIAIAALEAAEVRKSEGAALAAGKGQAA